MHCKAHDAGGPKSDWCMCDNGCARDKRNAAEAMKRREDASERLLLESMQHLRPAPSPEGAEDASEMGGRICLECRTERCACNPRVEIDAFTPLADPVNHPSHYTAGSVECIDAIEAALTAEEFQGYCKGQVFKYNWRAGLKGNALEDLQKAQWYLQRLIDVMGGA